MSIQSTPLTIATTSLPIAIRGTAYSGTITANGGTLPYSWSIASGTLPPGLALSPSTGNLGGMPATAGAYNFVVRVTDGTSQSTTRSFNLTVNEPSSTGTAISIWPITAVPAGLDGGPDSSVELGVKFISDAPGTIQGIRFYKGPGNTGTHAGSLWTSTGTLLASATFTAETASGWQEVSFATPVQIAANTVYVASYHAHNGHYSQDVDYFATAGADNPPLHALREGLNEPTAFTATDQPPSFRTGNGAPPIIGSTWSLWLKAPELCRPMSPPSHPRRRPPE